MSYTADGQLADFFRLEPMIEAARRTTERVGEDLLGRVVRHTPVAKPPSASITGDWLEARHRAPGTLRESWKCGELTVVGSAGRYTIDVYTDDPVAPDVEWDTKPHVIEAHGVGGVLRYWDKRGATVFAKIVHHPGTKGVHMMATALVEVAASWFSIASEEFRVWEREQLRSVR
jgi:hypothetical protein